MRAVLSQNDEVTFWCHFNSGLRELKKNDTSSIKSKQTKEDIEPEMHNSNLDQATIPKQPQTGAQRNIM